MGRSDNISKLLTENILCYTIGQPDVDVIASDSSAKHLIASGGKDCRQSHKEPHGPISAQAQSLWKVITNCFTDKDQRRS